LFLNIFLLFASAEAVHWNLIIDVVDLSLPFLPIKCERNVREWPKYAATFPGLTFCRKLLVCGWRFSPEPRAPWIINALLSDSLSWQHYPSCRWRQCVWDIVVAVN
jgi:hypothetical protein